MTDDRCDDYEADHDWELHDCDSDYWDDHGYDCDCDDCTEERAMDECGEYPAHLGGGCANAGSEYCEFECPFRDAMYRRMK